MSFRPKFLSIPLFLSLWICLALFCLARTAQAEVNLVNSRGGQLGEVVGYYRGLDFVFEKIVAQYPDLAPQVAEARAVVDSSLLATSRKSALDELKSLGLDTAQLEVETQKVIAEKLKDVKYSRESALANLESFKRQANGKIQEDLLVDILSSVPRYIKDPGLEMTDGWKQTFRVKGHPNAMGEDFSVTLPKSWHKRGGSRLGIEFFRSQGGNGPLTMELFVVKIFRDDITPTQEEITDLLSLETAKDLIPKKAVILDRQEITLEKLKGELVIWEKTRQSLDSKGTVRTLSYFLYHNNGLIGMMFGMNDQDPSNGTLDEQLARYTPTFKAISETLNLHDSTEEDSNRNQTLLSLPPYPIVRSVALSAH